jgi:hypothetical protein
MSAPDYTQRLTDRIFLLSPGVSTDVSGLEVRPYTRRGPVWRYADQAQIKNASAKLVDPNCFSWSRPVRSVCPYRCSTSLIADLPA